MSVAVAMLGRVRHESARRMFELFGIITTAQLLDSGRSPGEIRTMVRRGKLISAGRGVYAYAPRARKYLAASDGQRLVAAAAALAVVGSGAVLSHQSAARLWGIDLLGKQADVTALTCPRSGRKSRTGIHVYAIELPADHVTAVSGLPATSAARTVVDLARTGGFWDGLVAADSALRKKLTTKDEMRAVIGALRHWPGIRRAAEVVEFADRRSESALESIARAVIRDLGLPPPDLQVRLGYWEVPGLPAEPIARVDFYWKEYRTVAEVDGDLKYKDPARAKDQLRRDIELRAAGFEVVHFDWRDITSAPDRVAAVIGEAFVRGKLREQIARRG